MVIVIGQIGLLVRGCYRYQHSLENVPFLSNFDLWQYLWDFCSIHHPSLRVVMQEALRLYVILREGWTRDHYLLQV